VTPEAQALLKLEHVGKNYPKIDGVGGHIKTLLFLLSGKTAPANFSALDDISFSMRRGESMGIIGENGAGKSTLLKLIAGVIKPTQGSVLVKGRLSALLELGSGFHPEYTGLENIDLAAALLGIDRDEIRRKRQQIIDFADIGEHINQPLKHYSSGMVVRLGFAVATTVQPELLITDEVLAVGDESFQKKCIAWMERYLQGGGALLFCSHSMFHVQKLCRRALWIKEGRMHMLGGATEVTQAYLAYHEERAALQPNQIDVETLQAAGYYGMRVLSLRNGDGHACTDLEPGSELQVAGEVFSPDGRTPVVGFGIVRADGTPVYGLTSDMDGFTLSPVDPKHFGFVLRFPALALLPGRYHIRAHAMDPEGLRLFDTLEMPLTVKGVTREIGICRMGHEWKPLRS
jgi:lipopolysaccharide transport system ATP-binding protein